jgi:hypothetical protein
MRTALVATLTLTLVLASCAERSTSSTVPSSSSASSAPTTTLAVPATAPINTTPPLPVHVPSVDWNEFLLDTVRDVLEEGENFDHNPLTSRAVVILTVETVSTGEPGPGQISGEVDEVLWLDGVPSIAAGDRLDLTIQVRPERLPGLQALEPPFEMWALTLGNDRAWD